MRLIPDWRTVLKKGWSIRLALIAGLLSGVELVLPFIADWFPKYVFAALSFAVTMAAVIARLIAQPKMNAQGARECDGK